MLRRRRESTLLLNARRVPEKCVFSYDLIRFFVERLLKGHVPVTRRVPPDATVAGMTTWIHDE